jgi:hypothetical protein
MATMGLDGLTHYKVLDGPANKDRMIAFLNFLFAILRNKNFENVEIIMYNASFHRYI